MLNNLGKIKIMKERISTNLRKWSNLIIAIILYYIIHECSHIVVAIFYGVFEKVKILGLEFK